MSLNYYGDEIAGLGLRSSLFRSHTTLIPCTLFVHCLSTAYVDKSDSEQGIRKNYGLYTVPAREGVEPT